MKCLHVLKSPPNASTQVLMEALAQDDEVVRFNLYEDRDYARLVELIFSSDKVQSWW